MPIYRRKFPTFSCFNVKSSHLRRPAYPSSRAFLHSPGIFTLGKSSPSEANHIPEELSFINLSRISKSIAYNCSHLFNADKGNNLGLKDFLLRLSSLFPDTVRKFYRDSSLKTQDVLETLLCFESHMDKYENMPTMVESLWTIFNLASKQNGEFQHLTISCKIMGSILSRSGFLMEAEDLLSRNETQTVLLDCGEIFCNLIEGYLRESEFDKAISVYEKMRRIHLVPLMSTYQALLEYSIELDESRFAFDVYTDLIIHREMGRFLVAEKSIHENVIRLLCLDGLVREARELVMKAMNYGTEPGYSVIHSITSCYCGNKNYTDLFGFFTEAKVSPDVIIGNKILFSVCQNMGVDQANIFLQKLEQLGFCPDSISLGIMVGFSCLQSKLKTALFYMSDILSRGLKPHLYSYNALLSGIIKEGMWFHSREILSEMYDKEITPDLSTFRIILAGFCKARLFDEMKAIIIQMSEHKLIELSQLDDSLSKGFIILGLNPLSVKIRRDNCKSLYKAEFFDTLGNGLYLDTNLDEFERKINQVIDDGMLPNFDSIVMEQCLSHGVNSALIIAEEMVKWGQELSLPASSSFLSSLCKSGFSISIIKRYLGSMSKSIYQLDDNALNVLVQTYSYEGLSFKARTLVDGMVRRHFTIDYDTYIALFVDVCKRGELRSFQYYQKLAQKCEWSAEAKKVNPILRLMCKRKWFKEAVELFGEMKFFGYPDFSETVCLLVKELSDQGFTSTALDLFQELPHQTTVLSNEIYNCLLSRFCQEKKFSEAFGILDFMVCHNLSLPVDVISQLVLHLCRIRNFETAVDFENQMSRYQLSTALHLQSALIKGFCKYGNVDEAASLLRETPIMNSFPDDDIFNALLVSYSRRNNWQKVKETLGFMIRKKVTILISSYSNLARLICPQGKLSSCMNLKKLVIQVTDLPGLVLYNILIFHISSTRNKFLLHGIINSFLEKRLMQFDDVSYNFLIRGCLLCNDLTLSLHYLKTMIKHGFKPSNRSLTRVIQAFCSVDKLELALNLSHEMETRNWIHGSVIQISIVDTLLKNGMLCESVEFLNRMAAKDLIPSAVEYDSLIRLFCLHDRLDMAVDLLNIMLRKQSSPESVSYDYIIQGFCRSNKPDRALDFYAEMLCMNLKPSMITWDSLIQSLCKCDRVEEAEKLVESMIRLGEIPRPEMFDYLISKYRSLNNSCKIAEVMKAMQEMGYVPDFNLHWSVVSDMSSCIQKKEVNRGFISSLINGFGVTSRG